MLRFEKYIILFVLLALTLPMRQVYATDAEPVSDVRILIDVSGSMKKNDPNNLRSPALRLIVGLLPDDAQSGVWTFGKYVNMLVPLRKVNDAWKLEAERQSEQVHSYGLFTNIEQALNKATANQKGDNPKYRRSVILLSDGLVDVSTNAETNKKSRQRILDVDVDVDVPDSVPEEDGNDTSTVEESGQDVDVSEPEPSDVETDLDVADEIAKSEQDADIAADDVDALLDGLDIDLPEEESEGIDLSSSDDDIEESAKKPEAESVNTPADSANNGQDDSEEEFDIDQVLEEQGESENSEIADDVDALLASVDADVEPTPEPETEEIEQVVAEQAEPEVVENADDIDALLASV
ncbi:MAG: VWA domain-containing protein, partial [Gammaproteobacteria bacterium]|nr:VWA domain-containing protein [Gammaproteobacteria bacterium]